MLQQEPHRVQIGRTGGEEKRCRFHEVGPKVESLGDLVRSRLLLLLLFGLLFFLRGFRLVGCCVVLIFVVVGLVRLVE